MIAVFARPDHPKGYGFGGGRAHGFVVIFVRCSRREELTAVADKLNRDGLPEPLGHGNYQWYGGRMQHIATLPGNKLYWPFGAPTVPLGRPADKGDLHGRRRSLGDNRFVGFYDAAELIGAALPESGSPQAAPATEAPQEPGDDAQQAPPGPH